MMQRGALALKKNDSFKIPVAVSYEQYKAYYDLSKSERDVFVKRIIDTVNFIYDQGITSDTVNQANILLSDMIGQIGYNSYLKGLAMSVSSVELRANLILDSEAIEAAKEKKMMEVGEVLIMKNQKIVDKGEIITQEVYDTLISLNLVNLDDAKKMVPMFGAVLAMIILFISSYIYIKNNEGTSIEKPSFATILFITYTMQIIVVRLFAEYNSFEFIPLSIFACLAALLLNTGIALILNAAVLIICMFIFNGDLSFLLYAIISSSFSCVIMKYTEKRRNIVPVAVAAGLVNMVSYIAVMLFFEDGYSHSLILSGAYAGGIGLLIIVLAVGTLPIWEAAFEINTPNRLLELSNPNSELLRRLSIEAPGTYHHCLIVANLAESAAYDIGAQGSLVRAGAYYHDIGKLKYPHCFVENQVGENIHDTIEPSSSARMIIEHVSYGLELAEQFKLPKVIKAMISEHHGSTTVRYFYHKAVQKYGKENVDISEYRYPGSNPKSRETAIIMLADTVEAAVRSFIKDGKDDEEVKNLIEELIRQKLSQGQLDESGLLINDLNKIRDAFVRVFKGMNHNRIAYPKEENNDKEKMTGGE